MKKNKVKEIIYYLNVLVSLGAMFHLFAMQRLLSFSMKYNIMVDALHNGIFSEYATKEQFYISRATLVIFLTGFVALCFYWLFNRMKKEATAHVFLVMATAIHTIAGLYYLLIAFLWTDWILMDSAFRVVLYIVLLLLGIAVCVWGIFFDKNKGEGHTKKWIPVLIGSCMAVVITISMAIPFYMLNEARASINEMRQLIDNQPDGYDENIGYQISNYCHGEAVYAEDKLYVIRYDSATKSENIWTVDEQGDLTLFWDNPKENTHFSVGLSYFDGYLYARNNDNVVRISTSDASMETLIQPDGTLEPSYLGIRDNQLLVSFYDNDFVFKIYAYPLTDEFSKEEGILYDAGLYNIYSNQTFVNRYSYNNQSDFTLSFGSNEWPYASIEDSVYTINYYGGDPDYCGFLIKETHVYNAEEPIQETGIDSYVWRYNIFDGKIFYIKGEDTFEAWCCDADGENKEMIGTLPYSEYDSCYQLYMAENYMVVYIENRKTDVNSAYLMWLDDGSYKKLW